MYYLWEFLVGKKVRVSNDLYLQLFKKIGIGIGLYRLRASKNWITKLRAMPSRFFILRMCPLFSRGRFFVRPQNALSFFFFGVWALFFLEGAFFDFFSSKLWFVRFMLSYLLSMFFSVQSLARPTFVNCI